MTGFHYRAYNAIYASGKAVRLLACDERLPNGGRVIMKAWIVPSSPKRPEGLKYSLVYIDGGGRRLLGCDNAEGKGHHRHEGGTETPVPFESMEKHMALFLDELRTKWGVGK